MRKLFLEIFTILLLVICYPLQKADAQNVQNETIKVDSQIFKQLNWLKEILSIPNNSYEPQHIESNLQWLERSFYKLGFSTQRLENDGLHLFFAEYKVSEEKPTILFYMHFDGQPADPSQWNQPDPYKPVLKTLRNGSWVTIAQNITSVSEISNDHRVFARSASDDKGPIAMFLAAFEEIVKDEAGPAYNVKVILDSMEERGSPFLASAVKEHAEVLRSDYLVVPDGPMHDSGQPTLLYGVRGIIRLTMEVYGPARPQHSGHFGNYAPNPVFRASEILSTMKDDEGRVTIPGYYDGINLTENDREILRTVPDDEEKIKSRAGFKISDKVGTTYQEAIQFPSLNVLGIRSGWVGEQTRTIVPEKAIIEMDIRTVPESGSERLVELVKGHIREQGYQIVDHPLETNEVINYEKPVYISAQSLMYPFRTPVDSNIGNWLRNSLMNAHGEGTEIVQIRISGGSVPLSFFINELDIPAVLVPLVNADNNQHSPNENLRIGNYFNGIKSLKSILTSPVE